MHPMITQDAPGKCPICHMGLVPLKNESQQGHLHDDSNIKSKAIVANHGDDRSSMKHKGMKHGKEGHAHHEGMIDDFKKRFYVVLVLTVPIMALSTMIQHWLKVDWSFTGSGYILLILSSIAYFYRGWPFLQGLVSEVKARSLGMMTSVGVAIKLKKLYPSI